MSEFDSINIDHIEAITHLEEDRLNQQTEALRPHNLEYDEDAWWVHLSDKGKPLCGNWKSGWTLLPELIDLDTNPHICQPCLDKHNELLEESQSQRVEDENTYNTIVAQGLR